MEWKLDKTCRQSLSLIKKLRNFMTENFIVKIEVGIHSIIDHLHH